MWFCFVCIEFGTLSDVVFTWLFQIRSWSDGKRKNIRALLCSLDTVLWEEEKRWKKVGMHELVSADQVCLSRIMSFNLARKALSCHHPSCERTFLFL
jgi:hypothetical protein